jgi:hypothetical protein
LASPVAATFTPAGAVMVTVSSESRDVVLRTT